MAHCLSYFILLDSAGYPVIGTQQGFNAQVNSPQCSTLTCQYAVLQTTAYTAPAGMHVCLHPQGIRYFYGIGKNGHIIPNSLIESINYPNKPGSCQSFLEYKKFCNN